jgi:hypothetical protein
LIIITEEQLHTWNCSYLEKRFEKIVTARFLVDANAKTKSILRLLFQSSKITIKEKKRNHLKKGKDKI